MRCRRGCRRAVGQRLHELAGERTLDGEHRVAIRDVGDIDVEVADVRPQPGDVGLVVGGVRDGQEAVGRQAVGEQVVEHAAVLVAQQRVLRAADRDLRDVVAVHPLQEGLGVGAADLDLAHVRDVEDARLAAHGEMLGANAVGVLDRHLPAGERHELRARAHMRVEQGRALEGRRGHRFAG
jgi:hypothetical protein